MLISSRVGSNRVGLSEITRGSVFRALEEFRELGRDAFLRKHDFGYARSYYIRFEGDLYDSKAIAGVAHGYLRPDLGPLRKEDFSGGATTVDAKLSALGFEVVLVGAHDTNWHLEPGDEIKRTTLHQTYGGSGQGGISPSRSSPNVLVFTDRSVGEQHGYLDRWEGTTLHYTGEGQTGDQEMIRGNKAIRDHVNDERALRVFEGSSGVVAYVGEFGLDPSVPWYLDRAPETGLGPMRDVIMFRLVPIGVIESEGLRLEPAEVKPRLKTPYVPVPEDPQTAEREVYRVDPEIVDRGLRGHRETQNAVAAWAARNGHEIIKPSAGEPPFDVGWWDGERFNVVEVKSRTPTNELHQLRMGLGQVLEYAYRLRSAGIETKAYLAVESKPNLDHWFELCREHEVNLIWPAILDG